MPGRVRATVARLRATSGAVPKRNNQAPEAGEWIAPTPRLGARLLALDFALHEDRAVCHDLLAGGDAAQDAELALHFGADVDAAGAEDVALGGNDHDRLVALGQHG